MYIYITPSKETLQDKKKKKTPKLERESHEWNINPQVTIFVAGNIEDTCIVSELPITIRLSSFLLTNKLKKYDK